MSTNRPTLVERLLPLLLGIGVGILLVQILGKLPPKWSIFAVAATIIVSIMTLTGLFSRHLPGTLLFLAVASLPTFYDITFFYRENVRFAVEANGFPINTFDILALPLFLAWLYEQWSNPEAPKIRFPRTWLAIMLILLGINLISALFVAAEPFFSFSMIYSQVKCYLIMFFLANYVRDQHTFRVMGYAFAFILIFEGLVVLEQRFLGVIFTAENLGKTISLKSVVGSSTLVRVAGTLNHPNDLAMYLNLSLPLVGFMLITETKPLRRLYLGAAVLLALIAELWSGSRGGWMGLACALGTGAYFYMQKQGKNPLIGLLTGGFALSMVFAMLFAGSQVFRDRLVEGDAGAAEVRLPLMEVAMEMIKENPVLGVGLNLYTREMVPYDRTNHFIAYRYNHPVHNTFLMFAAETGLLSLLMLSTLIVSMLFECHRVAMRDDGIVAVAGLGVMGALISWVIHNQVNLTAPYNDTTLWALMGLLAAASNHTSQLPARNPHV
jgi:putative inorganic carbon (HCO3(-)) transporter